MKYPKELIKLAHRYRDEKRRRECLDKKINYYRKEMKVQAAKIRYGGR